MGSRIGGTAMIAALLVMAEPVEAQRASDREPFTSDAHRQPDGELTLDEVRALVPAHRWEVFRSRAYGHGAFALHLRESDLSALHEAAPHLDPGEYPAFHAAEHARRLAEAIASELGREPSAVTEVARHLVMAPIEEELAHLRTSVSQLRRAIVTTQRALRDLHRAHVGGTGATYSDPVIVRGGSRVRTSHRETSCSADQVAAEMRRLQWVFRSTTRLMAEIQTDRDAVRTLRDRVIEMLAAPPPPDA